MTGEQAMAPAAREKGRWSDYIRIARLDHSTKHIFIVPGMVLAYLLRGVHVASLPVTIVCALVAALCIASANYVINEFLDREFDSHHPTKSQRSAVQRKLDGTIITAEWFILIAAGLGAALIAGKTMFFVALVFGAQGIAYNVEPLRTKDHAFLDVISESINNPLRLMIGWAMIDPTTLPPASVILAFWLGGAFLMAAKRLSEFREITALHGDALLTRYRASFAGYTESSLTVSCFLYALLSSFFLAVFLVKYRIEYILTLPVIAILLAHYLSLALQPGSSAQRPEKLFREKGLITLLGMLVLIFALGTMIDLPMLDALTSQHFISVQ